MYDCLQVRDRSPNKLELTFAASDDCVMTLCDEGGHRNSDPFNDTVLTWEFLSLPLLIHALRTIFTRVKSFRELAILGDGRDERGPLHIAEAFLAATIDRSVIVRRLTILSPECAEAVDAHRLIQCFCKSIRCEHARHCEIV